MNKAQTIIKDAQKILKAEHSVSLEKSSGHQLASAIAKAALMAIGDDWAKSRQKLEKGRRAAYISAEYLCGRAINNNLFSKSPYYITCLN